MEREIEKKIAKPFLVAETIRLKKAEEGLRQQNEFLNSVVESLTYPFYVIDTDSYAVKMLNSAARQNRTGDDFTCYALTHRADSPCKGEHICPLETVKATKRPVTTEHIHYSADGDARVVEVYAYPILGKEGNVSQMIEYSLDITERKRAEEALKHSEERYALAQRVANIGSWDWDVLTGKLNWSETIEPIFGFKAGQFRATYEAFLECVHPQDRRYVIDSVNACIEQGEGYDIEHRILWPNGRMRWVLETGNVLRDENGRPVRMLGIVKDITERKQAEEVLKRDKDTFERLVNERTQELVRVQAELDKAKRLSDIGTLAATVAHELRNPLGVIRTAAYNIARKRKEPAVDKHLANIEKKVSESGQIINNLLSYSRIKMPAYEKIKVYDVLNECLSLTQKQFSRQKIEVNKELKSIKDTFIEADPLQLKEIFNNILTNAYQALTDKKGKIEVSSSLDKGKVFTINVKDNGGGIDREDLNKVFDPFFTRKSRGTGLGLTICNELVHLHSGRIDIASGRGKGTSVTVTLPLAGEQKK